MALSEVRTSNVKLRRVDSVGPEDTVRHVDQLTERELETFLEGLSRNGETGVGLDIGDVVVFTDYYRVEAV